MDNKQLYEKQSNQYNPIFPLVRLEDIIETISDKSIQWILNNYNHIYVEYSESIEITRNKVPSLLRRNGLWITYNTGKETITEYYKGSNNDVLNYTQWTLDDNWERFDKLKYADGSITYQHLSDAVKQLLGSGNTITNYPDDEDLTVDGVNLKLKDREYDKDNFSGLGRIILRKNIMIIDGQPKNILTQAMINKENTIYEIRYDFDLNGNEITVPEGCVLDFQGGSLSNGTITGTSSIIKSNPNIIFYNIVILGTWLNDRAFGEWFGKYNDDSVIIRNLLTLSNNIILKANSEYHLHTRINFTHKYNIFDGNGSTIYLEDNLISNGVNAEAFFQYGDLKFTNCKLISNMKSPVTITNDFKVFWNEKDVNLYVDNVDFYHEEYVDDINIIVFFLMSNKNVTIKNGSYTIKTGSYRGGFCWIYPHTDNGVYTLENLNIDQETGDEVIGIGQPRDYGYIKATAYLSNINILQKSHKNTVGFSFLNGSESSIDAYLYNVNYKVADDSYPVYTMSASGKLKSTIIFNTCNFYNNTNTYTFSKASGNVHIVFNNCDINDNAQYWFGGESNFWNEDTHITIKNCNLEVKRDLFQNIGNLGNIPAKGKFDLINCIVNINSNRLFSTYNCFGDYKVTLLNNVINVNPSIGTFDIDESYTGVSYNRLNDDLGYLIAVNNKIIKGSEFFDFNVIHKWSDKTFLFVNASNNKFSANYIYNGFNQDASNIYVKNIFDYPESENLPSLVVDGAAMQHTKNGTTNLTIPKVLKITKDNKAYFIPIIGYNKNYLLNNTTYGNNEEVYISRGVVSAGDITLNINDKVLRIAKDRSTFWEVPLNDMKTKYVGNNNERPTNPNKGFQYYDIYLNKPIWWTGTKWVDATGADV